MLAKSICVLFSAKAGVGKSTSAKLMDTFVKSLGYDSVVLSFASRLKVIAKNDFNWDGQKNDLGRRLLQEVGQTGRNYDQDMWVDYLFEEVIPGLPSYPLDFVLIDDWRFPNEEARVKEFPLYSVYTVRIENPALESLKNTPYYNDISEVSLDDKLDFDFFVKNNGSREQLEQAMIDIVKGILAKEKTFGGK